MGKIMSVLSRKVNRFNVENRAYKILEKEKPTAAPKYEANLKDLQRASEVDPGYVERESKKDVVLDERLKQVFVTSKDSVIDYSIKRAEAAEKALPVNRAGVEDFEFGYMEPKTVSRGKCTLRQAMKFITDNQGDPSIWTLEKIADEYQLKHDIVGKILTHFRSFQIHIPDINKKGSILKQYEPKFLKETDDSSKT